MTVSLKDIAERAGVSASAVSLYFKDPETSRVGKTKKELIRQISEELGYRPNVLARSLVSQKSHVVCALIPMDEPFFRSLVVSEILAGIQSILFQKGYSLVFPPSTGRTSPEHINEQLKNAAGYDGFILFGTRHCSEVDLCKNIEELQRAGKPFVAVNMEEMPYQINQIIHKIPANSSPIQYLLDLGHQRVLLVAGSPQTPDSKEAVKKYSLYHEQRNLPIDQDLVIYGNYERLDTKVKLGQLLENRIGFTAIYCLSDNMVLGVYEALSDYGVTIPDDVSVIGKGDLYFEKHLSPPLTVLRTLRFEEGIKGAELLLHSMENDEEPKKTYLESELILRASTRILK